MSPVPEPSRLATMTFAPPTEPGQTDGTATLLVIDDSSSILHRLPESGEVLIGRARDAQVRLTDNAVSRHHARLSIRPDGVFIEDLGSHNGARVNGERIVTLRELSSGDVIAICGVTLVFQRPRRRVHVRPIHDTITALRNRLEEEVARATQTHRAVSLVTIYVGDSVSQQRALLLPLLSRVLRIIDMVAWEGETRLWVLLPELDEREASTIAARLVAETAPLCAAARAGTATCPTDGIEADALLAGARAAIEAALPGQVRSAATTMTTLQVGERAVLIADPAMMRLYALIQRLAQADLPVLIHGETGSGKELAVQALHEYSRRKSARLVSLNCAALPDSLAESELFGHEKGAFSGAAASKVGFIEAAHQGTLFLDEIGELSLPIQAKLLRVFESKKLIRVGDTRERSIDVRIVAATHRNLAQEVEKGRFREDLFFRLNSAVLTLPPLRERPRELPLLARSFLDEACARAGRPPLIIAPATMELLLRHRWPGNVRELRNVMEYAATVVTEPLLEPEHLPDALHGHPSPAAAKAASVNPEKAAGSAESSRPSTSAAPLAGASAQRDAEARSSLHQTARSILRTNIADKLEAIEEALIREALTFTAGNKTAAALLLGTNRKVIERRLEKFGGTPT